MFLIKATLLAKETKKNSNPISDQCLRSLHARNIRSFQSLTVGKEREH